jgi:hypothetical protein
VTGLRNRSLLGLVLVIIGAIVALTNAMSLRSILIPIEAEFGFFTYLPLAFFVGLAVFFIGFYMVFRFSSSYVLLFSIVVLAVIIWCLPVFALQLPYHPDSFWHMGTSQWLLNNGKLDFDLFKPYTSLVYLQYPSLFVNTVTFELFSSLNPISVMPLFTIGITALFVVIFYTLSNFILRSKRNACLVTVLAVVGNGAMFGNHYSPSAFGEMLFPLMILVLLQTLASPDRVHWFLLAFLTFFAVTVHGPTSFLFLFAACVIAIFPNRLTANPEKKSQVFTVALYVCLIFFVWEFLAANWGSLNLSNSLKQLYGLFSGGSETTLQTTILSRQVAVFPLVGWIKRGIFLVFVVPACFIVAKDFLRKNVDKIEIIFLSIVGIWLVCSLVTEISDRFLMWVVPFAVLLPITKISGMPWKKLHFKHFSGFVVIGTCLLSILTLMTTYSGVAIYINTHAEASGYSHMVTILKNNESVYDPTIDQVSFYDTDISFLKADSIGSAQIIIFDRNSYSNYYYTNGGNVTLYTESINACQSDPNLIIIYSNPDFVVFKRIQ